MSFEQTQTASQATAPTKEERIAAIDKQIANLQLRRQNIIDGVVTAKVKKEVTLPTVGSVVKFNYGRKTDKTEPTSIEGTVIAIKPAAKVGEKTTPAQVKVEYGEGFDKQFAVIYPAQITSTIQA